MRFDFAKSTVWDGSHPNRVDPRSDVVTIKVPKDDEARARRKLPPAGLGRTWILVGKRT